ncbi:MAG: hypothetical protein SCARUB_02112 [Candidatus Scalindua rubra]|uniref:Uncharacterized protein n=1 Tax=Candidatus Scalindua rubra TaxID=1872076 RepID=A0A1E3XAU8_9BACT|nr:MAG: hypothetical protein SCARUB_02112 [Candidatus Scalindua rubra]
MNLVSCPAKNCPTVRWALGKLKDVRACESLIASLKDKNLEVVAAAYSFFIKRGMSDTETVLIEALDKYGTKKMAMDFLSCRNSDLKEAAYEWAKIRGYKIKPYPDSIDVPVWGNNG